jgi:colanic acid/amylovoran biosynthesis glycosyltransferase
MPIVASYCTTFLKPEMQHIYRQVTGLRRYRTVVLAKERQCPEKFAFEPVELLPRPRSNFLRRFYLKYIRHAPPIFYRGEFQVLKKALQRAGTDFMHIYFGHTGVHLLPFIEVWEGRCVVSFHGADVMLRPERPEYEVRLRALLQKLPLVLARSESLCAKLIELGCPAEKIRLNRTGIPLDRFPYQAREIPIGGRWRFVQACRLIPKKGLRTALRAFAQFLKTHPESRFVIAGEGPMAAELAVFVRELKIADAVEFPGFLDQAELAALYYSAHFFLHPSELTEDQNQEGIPNSMLEAMSTGLPVLATTHGGIPEAVTHGKTGLLVPERDHDALFSAMRELTSAPELCHAIGRAASQTVSEEFEQSRQIAKLESYYDEVTGNVAV